MRYEAFQAMAVMKEHGESGGLYVVWLFLVELSLDFFAELGEKERVWHEKWAGKNGAVGHLPAAIFFHREEIGFQGWPSASI